MSAACAAAGSAVAQGVPLDVPVVVPGVVVPAVVVLGVPVPVVPVDAAPTVPGAAAHGGAIVLTAAASWPESSVALLASWLAASDE